ncbi:hypothetical protein H0H87_010683 [Tephrocybe sp. NHM501043]|nr:hypothetical protein H0H87_010683 [Tephrocybe sp. NHM501043]
MGRALHNIHVDDGLTGLPPSWTTSLTQAGFTEEEILEIQSRRQRSPGSSSLVYTDRPASPAHSITQPAPRTTSLPRQADGSLASPPPMHPPIPVGSPIMDAHARTPSITSVASFIQDAPTIEERPRTPPRRPPPPPSYHTPPIQPRHTSNTPTSRVVPPQSPPPPMRPPPPPPLSPPLPTRPVPSTPPPPASEPRPPTPTKAPPPSSFSVPDPTTTLSPSHDRDSTLTLTKRLTALPPRLSLHKSKDSTDLASWGEALLSGISSAGGNDSGQDFANAQRNVLGGSREGEREGLNNSAYYERAEGVARQRSRGRVPPLAVFGEEDEEKGEGPSSSTVEPARTARYDPAAMSWEDDGEEEWEKDREGEDQPLSAPSDLASPLWDDIEGMLATQSRRPGTQIFTRDALSESLSPTLLPPPPRSPLLHPSHHHRSNSATSLGEPAGGAGSNRNSSRSSTSTVLASEVASAVVVRSVSVARRAGAKIHRFGAGGDVSPVAEVASPIEGPPASEHPQTHPLPSPMSSTFGSSASGSGSGSASSGSEESSQPTPTSLAGAGLSVDVDGAPEDDKGLDSSLNYYMDADSASPLEEEEEEEEEEAGRRDTYVPRTHPHARHLVSATDTFGGPVLVRGEESEEEEEEYEEEGYQEVGPEEDARGRGGGPGHGEEPDAPHRPRIVISSSPLPTLASHAPTTALSTAGLTPLSPFQRYRGWLSAVVAPLEAYIDDAVDPREVYLDLQEIAEGESGSVFAARLVPDATVLGRLRLPEGVRRRDGEDLAQGRTTVVAIKSVAILPSGSPKLVDLERELGLMRVARKGGEAGVGVGAGEEGEGEGHENILAMEAVYVDLVEDALWIRMELMERSLADVIGLVPSGLILGDRTIARFASDVLQALEYLQKRRIAHRDVRSDNLLVNNKGVLKLTDFSTAVQVPKESSMCTDPVGVAYWQAPEVRSPPYDALKVDVWSLGATVWEMAETEPPFAETQQFADRWPPLSNPQLCSPAYHDFLRLCSEPPATRPSPCELAKIEKSPFINNACGRPVIVQLIAQCMAIEHSLLEGEASRGPASFSE